MTASPDPELGERLGPEPRSADGLGRLELLAAHLTAARWFAGKGRMSVLRAVTPLPWLSAPGTWPAVRLEIAEMAYGGGGLEHYQLALSYRPSELPELDDAQLGWLDSDELGPVAVYDATRDPDAARLLLAQVSDGVRHPGPDAEVAGHAEDAGALAGDLEPRPFAGQQSNTSILYGDVAMLKLFRRLELGRNLDIEVHAELSRDGCRDVARLYGWLSGRWTRSGQQRKADLGMVVEQFRQATDGWELALRSLIQQSNFAGEARMLGRALAEIHVALRAHFPIGELDGSDVAAAMRDRLSRAAAVAPQLCGSVRGLLDCFGELEGRAVVVQRVHGDFHLGQTLRISEGWKIIDFEGEPIKTLAERRRPDSVWRDVAGMLRSFDYAAATSPGGFGRQWAEACSQAFLDGYTEVPRDAYAGAGNADYADLSPFLRAYVADKAVYEVVYEVRHRPDWVQIPLAAVAALAAGSSGRRSARFPPSDEGRK